MRKKEQEGKRGRICGRRGGRGMKGVGSKGGGMYERSINQSV